MTRMASRSGWTESLESLGVRAEITVYSNSGIIVVRVAKDVVVLLREWLEPRRVAGVCVFVTPGLFWWEHLWARVQWRESSVPISAAAVMRMAQREAGVTR